jgi:hypothetical protein
MFTVVIDCCEIRNKTQAQLGVSNELKLPKPEGTDVKWRQGIRA